MIEDIKKEVEHCFDGVYLEDKSFIIKTIIEILDKYKDIDKYKNAWEELKKTTCINEPYDSYYDTGGKQSFEEVFSIFEKLEKKHNIGSEE